jgi:hypothetical protein
MATKAPEITRFEEEEELVRWSSEDRLHQERSQEFYSTVIVLGVLVGIIFFFIEGIMPVLLVAAIVFVVYALGKTPPGKVDHLISNKGITTGNNRYLWEDMGSFWFEDKGDRSQLRMLMPGKWPGQLIVLLPPKEAKPNKEDLKQILLNYLPLEKPNDTMLDKIVDWFKRKVPLE